MWCLLCYLGARDGRQAAGLNTANVARRTRKVVIGQELLHHGARSNKNHPDDRSILELPQAKGSIGTCIFLSHDQPRRGAENCK